MGAQAEWEQTYNKIATLAESNPQNELLQGLKKSIPSLRSWGRLDDLGDRLIQLSKDVEAGKQINPKTLKKLGGQIKWWSHRLFYS